MTLEVSKNAPLATYLTLFIKKVSEEVQSRNKHLEQRALVEVCGKAREELLASIEDPVERESLNGALKGLTRIIITQERLSGILYQRLDFVTQDAGSGYVLIRRQGTFDILTFLCPAEGADRRRAKYDLLMRLDWPAKELEKKLGLVSGSLLILDPQLPRLDVINKENLVAQEPSTPAENGLKKVLQPASVVILDVEGQYFQKLDKLKSVLSAAGLPADLQPVIRQAKIGDDSSLSYSELNIAVHLPNFIPDLSAKSQDTFRVAIDNVLRDGTPATFDELLDAINYEVENNQIIHISIKKALMRSSESLRRLSRCLFDLPNTAPVKGDALLEPGKMTVVDVSDLDEESQRHVAIYLMSTLDQQKMQFKRVGRVVLVLDEAHKLFPKRPPTSEKDYFQRIYGFVRDVNHRGRKKQFSVIVATQHPTDVADDILALCDTKAIFEVDSSRWVAEQIGDGPEPRGPGLAYVVCKGTLMDPVRVRTFDVMGLVKGYGTSPTSDPSTTIQSGIQVGYVLQRESFPLKYRADGAELCAYSPAPESSLVHPCQLVVVRGVVGGIEKTVYCKVKDINKGIEKHSFVTSFEKSQLGDHHTEEYQTLLKLTPILEQASDGYRGPFRNADYTNAGIILPTEAEIRDALRLPAAGFPLGEVVVSDQASQRIVYYYPYHPTSYAREEDEWLVDHSTIVVGSQGRGKTNLVILLSYLVASQDPEKVGLQIHRIAPRALQCNPF